MGVLLGNFALGEESALVDGASRDDGQGQEAGDEDRLHGG
jgi:hypothetical protein